MPELSDADAVAAVKFATGYDEGIDVCVGCVYFRRRELNDTKNVLPDRCARSIYWFRVSENGVCRYFKMK
jgi:hypothetical protein